jgi:hypothetical protein
MSFESFAQCLLAARSNERDRAEENISQFTALAQEPVRDGVRCSFVDELLVNLG